MGQMKARVFYKLFRDTYDIFLTVSDYTMGKMMEMGVSPQRVVNVGNRIDVDYFLPSLPRADAKRMLGLPVDRRVVGTACRFVYEKDLPLFLSTAKAIHSELLDVEFILVGSGREEPQLRQLAVRLGIGSVVRFLGSRTDMDAVFRSFDVFLLTSRQESFGRTILESLASATPIVGVVPAFGGGRRLVEEAEEFSVPTNAIVRYLPTSCSNCYGIPLGRNRWEMQVESGWFGSGISMLMNG